MTDRLRREVLDQAVTAALLAVPSSLEGVSLAARLEAAQRELAAAVLEVRAHLDSSPLAPAIARDTAQRAGFAGEAHLVVGDNGLLFSQSVEQMVEEPPVQRTRATWVAEPDLVPVPPPPPVVVVHRPPRTEGAVGAADKRVWTTHLPSLEELRTEARALGINVEAFGRKKVELTEAIRATKAGEPVVLPPPEPTKGKLAKAAASAEDLDLDGILRPPPRRRSHA